MEQEERKEVANARVNPARHEYPVVFTQEAPLCAGIVKVVDRERRRRCKGAQYVSHIPQAFRIGGELVGEARASLQVHHMRNTSGHHARASPARQALGCHHRILRRHSQTHGRGVCVLYMFPPHQKRQAGLACASK